MTTATDVRRCLAEAKVRGVSDETFNEVAARLGSFRLLDGSRILSVRIDGGRMRGHHLLFLTTASILELTIIAKLTSVTRTFNSWNVSDIRGLNKLRINRYLLKFADGGSLQFGFSRFHSPQARSLLTHLWALVPNIRGTK